MMTPTNVTGSNIKGTPLELLKDENKRLETARMSFQNKEDRWNTAYLWLGIGTLLLGACSWLSQRQAAKSSFESRTLSDKMTANSVKIHDLERDAEADARRKLEKRTLSPQQFDTISENLRSLPMRTAQVSCPAGNEEAYSFAKQISRVLESAHWRTGGGTLQIPNAPQDTGITLFVRLSDSEGANQLRDVLAKVGIRATTNVRDALPDIIRVYVGAKP